MKMTLKKADLFYYLFIAFVLFNYALENVAIKNYNNSNFHDVIIFLSLLISLACFCFKSYKFKELLRLFIFMSVGLICYIVSGNTNLLVTLLAVVLVNQVNLDKLLRFIFIEKIILFLGIIAGSLLGMIPNVTLEINKYSHTTIGNALGFNHPNMFAAEAGSILLLFLCLKKNCLHLKDILFCIICSCLIFYISKSRTPFYLMLMVIVALFMQQKQKWKQNFFKILPYTYCGILILLTSAIAVYYYSGENHPLTIFINDSLFNGRIGLAARSLLVYPITLFGKQIDTSIWGPYSYYSLDNGQVMILLYYGIIGFLVYSFLFQRILLYLKRNEEYVLSIIFLAFIIWSTFEGTMYFIGKNYTFLFLGTFSIAKWNWNKGTGGNKNG